MEEFQEDSETQIQHDHLIWGILMMTLFYQAHSLHFSNRNANRQDKGAREGTWPCSRVMETGPQGGVSSKEKYGMGVVYYLQRKQGNTISAISWTPALS